MSSNSINMPGMTEEAKSYVLGLAFKQEPASALWLALSVIGEQEISLALLEENEPATAPGYTRRRRTPDDWTITVDPLVGPKVEMAPVTFRNTGPDKWPPLNVVFLTTGDRLIAWSYLQTTRELFIGDEIESGMAFIF